MLILSYFGKHRQICRLRIGRIVSNGAPDTIFHLAQSSLASRVAVLVLNMASPCSMSNYLSTIVPLVT